MFKRVLFLFIAGIIMLSGISALPGCETMGQWAGQGADEVEEGAEDFEEGYEEGTD